MSIGSWPHSLSYRLLCRIFVQNPNFKTRGGGSYISQIFPRGFCFAFNRSGRCTSKKYQFKHSCYQCGKPHSELRARKWSSPSVVSEIHDQSMQDSSLRNDKLLVILVPVRVSILKQYLEGYDSNLVTFCVKVLNKVFSQSTMGQELHGFVLICSPLGNMWTLHLKSYKIKKSMNKIAGHFDVPPFKNLQCSLIG